MEKRTTVRFLFSKSVKNEKKAFNSQETDVIQILPNINYDKPANRMTSSDTPL
ncbi:hypothetical protein NXY39_21175 [Bacteroides fragilis]|nr:hypothetical protein [Bacteroides fragilis]MCS2286496.1 hypothetical protein [Bacteroides fragilis]